MLSLTGGGAGGGGDGAKSIPRDTLYSVDDVHMEKVSPSALVTGTAAVRAAAVKAGEAAVSAISAA